MAKKTAKAYPNLHDGFTVNDILNFIKSFKKENGYVPVKSEIATGMKTTKQNIQWHFAQNKEKFEVFPEYKRYFAPKEA